ncbi:MAG TPA: PP2C family protein-serine/threonine phosphatase [Acidobacteriaceae bacterium]|jgi:serine phosphatase RsbU (regulator of sigma subunit)|nr:PP2C family protein-serine/threonine phosphatase [Acidobacteriaceae bacterium]
MISPSESARGVDTIDLQQEIVRLQALLETSRQVHSAIRQDEVMSTVLRIVVRELELPGALITDPPASYGDVPPAPWEGCFRFPLHDKEGRHLTELIVATPEGRPLTIYEEDFLERLALQAGVAVENARYYERSLEWARLQQDLHAARAIQRSLVPQQMPQIEGYSVAVRYSACYEVGGDCVDIVSLPDGVQVMAVADVAGKGLASAIVSTAFRSAFRASVAGGVPLAELVSRLNRQHCAEGDEARNRYVTGIFLRLDPAAHRLEVVNAGHNPGFVARPDGSVHHLEASATPVGILPFAEYRSEILDFPPGSRLLFYTDGLTEVFRGDEEFGTERLLASFLGCNAPECTAILDTLWQELRSFSGEELHQDDDMTALALMRTHA